MRNIILLILAVIVIGVILFATGVINLGPEGDEIMNDTGQAIENTGQDMQNSTDELVQPDPDSPAIDTDTDGTATEPAQ